MIPPEVFHAWNVHWNIIENEYLVFEWILIERRWQCLFVFIMNIPGETLQKNSSANMALSAGLARVRKRIRLFGNIVRWICTSNGFAVRWLISTVALRTNTHILLFFASNFKRISNVPDARVLLALFVDNEPRSLEIDFES